MMRVSNVWDPRTSCPRFRDDKVQTIYVSISMSPGSLCGPIPALASQGSLTIAIVIVAVTAYARPSLAKMLHGLEELLAITIGREIDFATLLNPPLTALDKFSCLWNVGAKTRRRTAAVQTRLHKDAV